MPLLTPQDHAFFNENGYLHLKNVVPKANAQAVVDAMFEFLGMSPDDPDDWYRPPLKGNTGGMVEMYHHQAMWDNRQHPRVYQLYSELLNKKNLTTTLDRVSFKLPENPKYPQFSERGFLHLDADLRDRVGKPPFRVAQGVIYLTDTSADQGGFHCVPGFFKKNYEWAALPDDKRPAEPPDYSKLTPTPIAGEAGDMIVWDVLTPHGSGPNRTNRPRLAQYVFHCENVILPYDREERIRRWRECLPTFSGDPRKIEETARKTATLTPLGRKLLGLDAWE